MKVKVILDERQEGKDEYPIKIRIAAKGKHTYLHTGFYSKSGTLKDGLISKHPNKIEINAEITRLLNALNTAYLEDRERLPEELKKRAQEYLKPHGERSEDSGSLLKFVELLISECEQGKLDRKHSTYQSYKTMLTHLQGYRKAISFNDIDRDFYHGFTQYLKENGNNANSIGKRIGTLKAFLNEAIERGLTTNREHQKKYFVAYRDEPETDYLSLKEIEELSQKKLPVKYLEEQRDRFVLNCYLGLRISDFKRISKDMVFTHEGKSFIKLTMVKTEGQVVVPLNSKALEILKRYKFSLPEVSDQKSNEFLKEMAKLTGIDKHLTNHTARRSFATNAYLAGVPTLLIMSITGHKTEKSFKRYIRAEGIESALAAAKHSFFQ